MMYYESTNTDCICLCDMKIISSVTVRFKKVLPHTDERAHVLNMMLRWFSISRVGAMGIGVYSFLTSIFQVWI